MLNHIKCYLSCEWIAVMISSVDNDAKKTAKRDNTGEGKGIGDVCAAIKVEKIDLNHNEKS